MTNILEFIHAFPDFDSLSKASQKDVLALWQGLGYNRRALALKRLAEDVVSTHGGTLPQDREGAVAVFQVLEKRLLEKSLLLPLTSLLSS